MNRRLIIAVTLIILAIFSCSLIAQEVNPSARKLRLKKLSFSGIPKGADLLATRVVGGEILYIFKIADSKSTPPGENWKFEIGFSYKGSFSKLNWDKAFTRVYSVGISTSYVGQPEAESATAYDEVESATVYATVRTNENGNAQVHLLAINMPVDMLKQQTEKQVVHSRMIYEEAGSKKYAVETTLADITKNEQTYIYYSINYSDQSKTPYKYASELFSVGYDPVKGFSKSAVPVQMPTVGDVFVHFAFATDELLLAYKELYKAPMMGSSYPMNDGGAIMLGKNNPSFKYSSVEPAVKKLRMRDVVKSREAPINYPVRQPRLVKWHDNSIGLIYQSITFASGGSTIASLDINYYYAPASSKARLTAKPKKLDFPTWKRILKEAASTFNIRHNQIPSYYIALGDGKYALLELFNFERRSHAQPGSGAGVSALPKHTELQGKVLSFDSKTMKVSEVIQLKVKHSERDYFSRCWALDRGDTIDFVISIFKDASKDYEIYKATLKKSAIK